MLLPKCPVCILTYTATVNGLFYITQHSPKPHTSEITLCASTKTTTIETE
jgi:hypothetical protein